MKLNRVLLLVVISLMIQPIAANEPSSDTLQIDDQQFPIALVNAYGKSTLNRNEYCPPVSDPFVLDKFVRNVLLARQTEINKSAARDIAYANSANPLLEKKEIILRILKNHESDSIIARVYRRQISGIEVEIDAAKARAYKDYKKDTDSRIRSNDRFRKLKDISDNDKQMLSRINAFTKIYAHRLRNSITEEDIKQRYDQLVQEKDEQYVNVHFFESREAIITSDDEETRTKVTEFLKSKLSLEDSAGKRPGNMMITGGMIDGRSYWSRADRILGTTHKNPELINVGSTLVSKLEERISGYDGVTYHLIYIFDKSYYPVINLHETTPDHHSASADIKKELFKSRLERNAATLRANAQVTRNGKLLTESNEYAACPAR